MFFAFFMAMTCVALVNLIHPIAFFAQTRQQALPRLLIFGSLAWATSGPGGIMATLLGS